MKTAPAAPLPTRRSVPQLPLAEAPPLKGAAKCGQPQPLAAGSRSGRGPRALLLAVPPLLARDG